MYGNNIGLLKKGSLKEILSHIAKDEVDYDDE